MTDRFARAVFQRSPEGGLIIVRTANGDYHELTALDAYHAESKLHQFARANRLILTECAGFDSLPASDGGREGDLRVASQVAEARLRSKSPRQAAMRRAG